MNISTEKFTLEDWIAYYKANPDEKPPGIVSSILQRNKLFDDCMAANTVFVLPIEGWLGHGF